MHKKKSKTISIRCKTSLETCSGKALLLHRAKSSTESPSLLPGAQGAGVPKLSLNAGLGMCLVMVHKEEGEPRDADKSWRWGTGILLIPLVKNTKETNKTHTKTQPWRARPPDDTVPTATASPTSRHAQEECRRFHKKTLSLHPRETICSEMLSARLQKRAGALHGDAQTHEAGWR